MIGLATPAWLLGLLLVPAIWYLHRSGPILRRHPVANLDLWQDSRERAMQAGERRRPDPAWLRRASILALLCIALAGPQWRRPAERVTIWVDDSLSMQTIEAGESRLDRGLRLAQSALRAAHAQDAFMRPLSEPARSYPAFGPGALHAIRSSAAMREPQLPPPDALDPTSAHWLVTDGADDAVNAWLGRSAIDRVIQVGTSSRNVGITRVTVRTQPAATSGQAIQVLLRNGGTVAESRTVEVSSDSAAPTTRRITIDAGASEALEFSAARSAQRVTARLIPADALAEDDVAEVDTASLAPLATHVDTKCPPAVVRSIAAHPALKATHGGDARLVIDCGSGWGREPAVPRIALHPGTPEPFDAAGILWSPSVNAVERRFAATMPAQARGRLDAARPADEVLLAAGEVPLVIARAGPPRVVETSLDLGAADSAANGFAPLAMAFLVDTALETPLLDRSVALVRSDAASMVAPRATLTAHPLARGATHGSEVPFVLPFVLLALALLAWDMLSLARRLLRDHVPRATAVA